MSDGDRSDAEMLEGANAPLGTDHEEALRGKATGIVEPVAEPLEGADQDLSQATDHEAALKQREHIEGIRKSWSFAIQAALIFNTFATVILIFWAMRMDWVFANTGISLASENRLVTTEVLLATIGATMVEIGVFSVIIAKWGFPKESA